jgi:soluble lytic murein transglycosylase-like protein
MVRLCFVLLTTVSILCVVTSANAQQIFVYKDSNGITRFTSKQPPAGVTAKTFSSGRGSYSTYKGQHIRSGGNRWRSNKLYTSDYSTIIGEASRLHRVSPSLIRAVIHAESAFNPQAVSPKGARGLMQLIPDTAKRFSVKNSFDPRENITGGSKYLSWLLKRYGGNLKYAVAAYNAGEGSVDKYRGVPPYTETQNYVMRVLDLQKRYSTALRG